MIRGRSDLPLSRDPSVRLVPWIIGLMTFLACLMLAGSLLLAGLLAQWSAELSGTVTVQVMPQDNESPGTLSDRTDKLVRLLERSDGVASARALPDEEIADLLRPWLGAEAPLDQLPLPRLIDVRLGGNAQFSMESLRTLLINADPAAVLDDHGVWQEQLAALVAALEAVAALMVVLMALATVGIVVFATRSGMAAHEDVIEVLHLIGAHDSYIAGQFQKHALRQGLRGGLIGLALGAATLWGLGRAAAGLDTGMLPAVALQTWHWLVLGAVPLATATIANWTARRTVIRSLRRMV